MLVTPHENDRTNEIPTSFDRITDTFAHLGIPSDKSIIVGGQVLNAHGIRPSHDLDVIVGPETFLGIAHGDHADTATISADRHRPGVLTLHDGEPMGSAYQYSADVICDFDPSDGTSIHDTQASFMASFEQSDTVHGLHFLPLENVVERLQHAPHRNQGWNKHKSSRDLSLIRAYLTGCIEGSPQTSDMPMEPARAATILSSFKKRWGRAAITRLTK